MKRSCSSLLDIPPCPIDISGALGNSSKSAKTSSVPSIVYCPQSSSPSNGNMARNIRCDSQKKPSLTKKRYHSLSRGYFRFVVSFTGSCDARASNVTLLLERDDGFCKCVLDDLWEWRTPSTACVTGGVGFHSKRIRKVLFCKKVECATAYVIMRKQASTNWI